MENYCQYLAEMTDEELTTVNYKGNKIEVCESVLEEHFFHCDDCGNYFHNDEKTTTGHNDEICDDCRCDNYFWCDYTDDCYHIDHSVTDEHGSYVYDTYAHDSMYRCPDCGHYSEYDHDDGHCCENCGYEVSSDDCADFCHDYDYRPDFKFFGEDSKENPFIGFEIEIEAKNCSKYNLAETCYESFKDCYLKNDGSLNDGFEVVSMPKTIQEHYKSNYSESLKEAIRCGGRSHDTSTCGLHFHIDKKYMSEGHKVRFGMFFSLCKKELQILARRSEERWCQYKETGLAWDEYKDSNDRYEAVNWNNRDTVEIRIFKGTLKDTTFFASMELCHAVYNFTMVKSCYSTKLKSELVLKRLIKFIKKKNRLNGSYQFLLDYLKQKDFYLESQNEKINA